jgi:two-component system sensor histidine kinase KdpD
MLRSAILDAFAHEFKTPLAIILAAAGGLRENSSKQLEQMEMTDIIENQTLRLSQLTTRLLRIARLDRDDVKPMMELTDLSALLSRIARQCEEQFGRRIVISPGLETVRIMADTELLGLAITQLLDNSCKYSSPESLVMVTLTVTGHSASVRVVNEGNTIRPGEEERIFERFSRGAETEHITPGAGLGLYVARKIVRAHDGVLEFLRDNAASPLTTFRIELPLVHQEQRDDSQTHESVGSGR